MDSRAISILSLVSIVFTILQGSPSVHAANDWSQPCFSGTCSYDLPTTSDGPSGTLQIWGAAHAIGDVTTAGGWEIVSCDPESLAQDLHIVCRGPEDLSACAHLFNLPPGTSSLAVRRSVASSTSIGSSSAAVPSESALPSDGLEQGAVGKIIRLPDTCGKSAFARIAKAWVPANQTIPDSISRRLVRRDGETPVVKAFSMDVDFASSDARYGPVNFAVVGANVPGASGINGLDSSSSNTSTSTNVTQRGITDFIGDAVDAISNLNDFDVNKTTTLKPLDINKNGTLIDQSIDCSVDAPVGGFNSSVGVNGHVKVDVDAKVHAVVSLGVAASGTIIPPKVENFGLTSGITADIDGSILLNAGVGGSVDSGEIQLFEIGVPGLDFPGVLSIGPTLEIKAEAKAELDLDVDLNVGVSYHVAGAQFVFPKGGKKGGTFTPGDTPLKLSVQPAGTATGTVEAHLIPVLNFGIEALGNTVNAGVFVNLDASATATLSVGATASQKNVTINPRSDDIAPRIGGGHIGHAGAGIRGRNFIGERYFTFNSKRSPKPFGLGNIVDGVKNAADNVGSTVTGAAKKVGGAVSGAAKKVTSAVTGAAKAADSDVKNAGSKVGSAVKSTAKKVGSAVTDTAKNVGSAVKNTAKKVESKVEGTPPIGTTSNSTAVSGGAPKASSAAQNGTDGVLVPSAKNPGAGGCVELDVGLSVNVGADADFFGLFDASTSLPLFEKTFTLFKKCFGDASQVQGRSVSVEAFTTFEKRAGLKCNIPIGDVTIVADETVPASNLV